MSNIVLIGMMGSGKSTIGKKVSKKLSKNFIDTDEIIERRTNKKISEIFELYGENYFRNLEKDLTSEISKLGNKVIATGGGLILDKENVKNLKNSGVVIYLKNNIDDLERRLKSNFENRPLLDKTNLRKNLKETLKKREQLYIDSADFIIENIDIENTIEKIIELEKIKSNLKV